MNWRDALDPGEPRFEEMFEPEGGDYLYRKSMSAPPVRVSAAERDRFVSDYRRRSEYVTWLGGILLFGSLVIVIAMNGSPGWTLGDPLPYVLAGASIALWTGLQKAVWNVPARALRDRDPAAEPRSREEVRRRRAARTTWTQLLGSLAVMLVWLTVIVASDRGSVMDKWLFAMMAAALLIMSRDVLMKWRAEQPLRRASRSGAD